MPGGRCWPPSACDSACTPAPHPSGQQYGVEVAVRMGLNTGLVIVGAIGDNLRMDYTAVGDTTNVAARLQQAAAAGQIRLSEQRIAWW